MAAEEDGGVEVVVYPAYGGRAGSTRRAEVGWKGLLYHTMDSSARSKCTDTPLFQACLAKRCLWNYGFEQGMRRACAKGYER